MTLNGRGGQNSLIGQVPPPFKNNKRKTEMKKNYYAPKSNVIKFEMREAMMLAPQSKPGNVQLSGSKNDWADDVTWDSTEEEAY